MKLIINWKCGLFGDYTGENYTITPIYPASKIMGDPDVQPKAYELRLSPFYILSSHKSLAAAQRAAERDKKRRNR